MESRPTWWQALTPAEQKAYFRARAAERRRLSSGDWRRREATARLDLALERGCFMREIPDADVAARMRAVPANLG